MVHREHDAPLRAVEESDGVDPGLRFAVLPRFGGLDGEDPARFLVDEHVAAFLQLADLLLRPRHRWVLPVASEEIRGITVAQVSDGGGSCDERGFIAASPPS